MRQPSVIAAELRALHDRSNLAFVPVNVSRALELTVEFADSVAATLEAAGIVQVDVPTLPADDQTPA